MIVKVILAIFSRASAQRSLRSDQRLSFRSSVGGTCVVGVCEATSCGSGVERRSRARQALPPRAATAWAVSCGLGVCARLAHRYVLACWRRASLAAQSARVYTRVTFLALFPSLAGGFCNKRLAFDHLCNSLLRLRCDAACLHMWFRA